MSAAARAVKRQRQCFAVGDFVRVRSKPTEYVVLRSDNNTTTIVSWDSVRSKHETKVLERNDWRDEVEPGALLEFISCATWHPLCVRSVERPSGGRAVLVVEPAFLGYTISIPLRSLRLRPLVTDDPDKEVMLRCCGFHAVNESPAAWPRYHPAGITHTRLPPPTIMAISNAPQYCNRVVSPMHDVVRKCWIVPSPCELPKQVVRVTMAENPDTRDSAGDCFFALRSDLFHTPATRKINEQTKSVERVFLGTRTFALRSDLSAEQKACLEAAKMHVRNGDFATAVGTFILPRGRSFAKRDVEDYFLSSDEPSLDLLEALLIYCKCATFVSDWHHGEPVLNHAIRETDSLDQTRSSLSYIDQVASNTLDVEEWTRLVHHVSAWTSWERLWRHARWIKRCTEYVLPLHVYISRLSDTSISFDVTLVKTFPARNPKYRHTVRWLKYGASVLAAFSPPPSSSLPNYVAGCLNPSVNPQHWRDELQRVCGYENVVQLAAAVLRAEQETTPSVSGCMQRTLVAHFGKSVEWNACEGAVMSEPETNAAAETVLRERRGGVIASLQDEELYAIVGCVLRASSENAKVVPSAPSLLLTSPTKMYEWQRYLSLLGLETHVYHGAGRRGDAARGALRRGETLIASNRVLCDSSDLFFFSYHVDGGFCRVIVDEFDISEPSSSFVDGLMRVYTRSVWILAQQLNKTNFTFALPLLRVEPFYTRADWLVDTYSDYRRRTHARAFVDGCAGLATFEVRRTLHDVARRMMFCVSEKARASSRPTPIVHVAYRVTGEYSSEHLLAVKCTAEKMMRRQLNPHVLRQINHMWRSLQKLAWGVQPDLHVCSDPTPWTMKHALLCPPVHCRFMVARAGEESASEVVRNANTVLMNAHVKKTPIVGDCPVCLEPFASKTCGVFVGQCAHFLCGECFGKIEVAEQERMFNEDWEGDPWPTVSCPLCREVWYSDSPSVQAHRPLFMPTVPGVTAVYRQRSGNSRRQDIVLLSPSVFCDTYVHDNPCVRWVRRLVKKLREGNAHRRAADPNAPRNDRIVLVTHSYAMSTHLYAYLKRYDTADCLCTCVDSRFNAKDRGDSILSIQGEFGNFDLLVITANLMRGLVLRRARHWIVCEPLTKCEANTVYRCAASAARCGGAPQQTVHTVRPSCISGLVDFACSHGGAPAFLASTLGQLGGDSEMWKQIIRSSKDSATGGKIANGNDAQTTIMYPASKHDVEVAVAEPAYTLKEYIRAFSDLFGYDDCVKEAEKQNVASTSKVVDLASATTTERVIFV